MLKKLLILIPFAFVIGCSGEESTDETVTQPEPTQEEIDSGEVPTAQPLAGGGND